jgi:hypothetical protein
MDSLKNGEKINNKENNSLDKEKSSEVSLNKIKENLKIQPTFNNNLKRTMIRYNDVDSLLGYEQNTNKFLFEDGYKSDDEENIQDQNDIYEFIGRKSIGELNNNEIEKDEKLKENNSEKDNNISEVVEKWKYEKILLNNNIIDYSCK